MDQETLDRRAFLKAGTAVAALAHTSAAVPDSEWKLWYKQPAKLWTDALPVGNGRLGAMVFGGVEKERLQLNEDTLWSGAPKDWNNPAAREHLAEMRRLVIDEANYTAADALSKKMQGPYNQSYLPLADLHLEFSGTNVAGYRRELDLDTAIATVCYTADGATLTREVFASTVDQVIAVRLTSTRALHCALSLSSALRSQVHADGATLLLEGKAPAHVDPNYLRNTKEPIVYDDAAGKGMHFAALVSVKVEGGAVRVADGKLRVEGASAATILIAGETGFRGYAVAPDTPAAEIAARARKRIEAASAKPYARLRAAHIADHQHLFRRVRIALPGAASSLPTDERLKAFEKQPDEPLLALYFQYGRYLLIASSRPGTQPANLQGIWNDQVRPPWSSNWTANINVQMNYWLAETGNLSECHQPMLRLSEDLSRVGRKTAEVNYGAHGWVSHHNVDIWRQTAPVGNFGLGSPTWANWPMSGPWFCQHLYEHYLFTGDREYLAKQAYPAMRGAAEFLLDWWIDDKRGHLTTCPSMSTENSFVTADGKRAEISHGCTMDIALARELFANCIAAAKTLGIDAEFATKLAATRDRILPYQVGARGELQEWSVDFKEREPGHRHMSHLYPVYPGGEITPRTNARLAAAARRSLELRLASGGAYTGWSRAWAIGLWARLGDGGKAHESLSMLLKKSTGPNLFDTHPAGSGWIFQIDGNFGGAASLAEMLLQSHEGELRLLPALPAAWPEGEIAGLCARGGFVVDIAWKAGKLAAVTVFSRLGGRLRLASGDRRETIETKSGLRYRFNASLGVVNS